MKERVTEDKAAASFIKLPFCRPGYAGSPYSIYIGLGANIGDRVASLKRALRLLAHMEDTQLLTVSSFYETPPWVNVNQPPFLNACAAFKTRLLPLVLLRYAQRIERALGRIRKAHWGPRTIDIDLLFAEGYESDSCDLSLPHPYLHKRAFVLVPLQEIAADKIICGKAIGAWLKTLPEKDACIRRNTYIFSKK